MILIKGKVLLGLTLIILLVPFAHGTNYETFHFQEDDAKGDVCYLRIFPMGLYRGKQYSDLDISYAEARYHNGSMEFILKVYGEIDIDGPYKYYFDIDTSHPSGLGYDIVLAYQEGLTTLEYQNNWTTFTITEWTEVSGNMLKMSVPVGYFEGYEIIEVQTYSLMTVFVGGKTYLDSTEPIEEDIGKDPTLLICISIPIVILCITLLIIYFFYKKKWHKFTWKFTKKQCPNCKVVYSRKMEGVHSPKLGIFQHCFDTFYARPVLGQ